MGGDGVVVRVRGVGPDLESKRGDRSSITPGGIRACQDRASLPGSGLIRLLFESSPVDHRRPVPPRRWSFIRLSHPGRRSRRRPAACHPRAPFSSAGASRHRPRSRRLPASTRRRPTRFGSWYQVTDDDERAATGLWVGRLDGPAFHVVGRADRAGGTGPWMAGSSSGDRPRASRPVSLVDTADESAVEVLRDGGRWRPHPRARWPDDVLDRAGPRWAR